MTKDIATWFRSAVLRFVPISAIECRPMVCPQIINVPPSPVRDLRLVRQRYERLAAKMCTVLKDAIARASWNSVHRDWLLDAEDCCLHCSASWEDLKGQADECREQLVSRALEGFRLYPSEERDVESCISAIRNASRALRALEAVERHHYLSQIAPAQQRKFLLALQTAERHELERRSRRRHW